MQLRKIVLLWCFCTAFIETSAQGPTILKRGGTDSHECMEWVETNLNSMTLKQKIGQLFIHTVAPHHTEQNKKNIRNAIKEYGIGGLLFSGGQWENQVKLTNYAQGLAGIPLLITFDGEWGLAMRLKGLPSFPKNRVLGCIQEDSLIYEYGKEVARQCREIGVHINFAPVADIDNNPMNPVINTRSFGGSPQNVANKVLAYSRGLEDGGVLSVCKHFPGHGDTNVDSHKALPVLKFTRERMDTIEMYPFRKAVEAGLGGVMVGHLDVPALSKRPASLSPEIIGILKEEYGFKGLVFTDALEMKGISNQANVCAQALIAGNDMLLAPRNLKKELEGVLNAVKAGLLTEEQITEKCRKVLTFKYALGLYQKQFIQLSGLEQRLKNSSSRELMSQLEKAAVTVVSNDGGILPLDIEMKHTALLNIGKQSQGVSFQKQLQRYLSVDCIQASSDSIASLSKRLQSYDRVIVAIHTEKYGTYQSLLDELADKKPLAYVYLTPLKNYYDKGNAWKKAAAVVLGHSGKDIVQRFVAEVLMGREKAKGCLSVEVKDFCFPGERRNLNLEEKKVYHSQAYGMDADVLSKIDEIALEGISAKAYPGCQILILKDGIPVYDKCFGTFTYGQSTKVQPHHLYDIASLTKTTATLLAVMKLYDEGKFGLTDRISKYVPELQGGRKERITIEELLFHQSGLPAFWPFYKEAIDDSSYLGTAFFKPRVDARHRLQVDRRLYVVDGFKYKDEYVSNTKSEHFPLQVSEKMFVSLAFPKRMIEMIASEEIPLKDRRYRYSCLNFMLLKEMVEQISGMTLDVYLAKEFYEPMGLEHTLYHPLSRFKKEQIVPTVQKDYLRNRQMLQGYVHDEIAAFMGGVSGNAGLFSNARDVAKIYQMLVDQGQYGGKRYLSMETCRLFMTHKSRISRRGLGFDRPDSVSGKGPCADEAPMEVVGHTGFTGTCAWADPKNRLVFVFLSNRIYPRPFDHKKLMTLNIRPRIQQLMYQALKE